MKHTHICKDKPSFDCIVSMSPLLASGSITAHDDKRISQLAVRMARAYGFKYNFSRPTKA